MYFRIASAAVILWSLACAQTSLTTTNDTSQWAFASFSTMPDNYTGILHIGLSAQAAPYQFSLTNPDALYSAPARDPSIVKSGGKWWVCHTLSTGATESTFLVTSSSDLIHWASPAAISITGAAGMLRGWAPEWFVDADASVHVLISLTADTGATPGGFQIYEMHPTTADLAGAYSAPVAITITGQSNQIDPYVVLRGGTYYLWYKNETTKYVEYASASTLTGTYTLVKSGDWAGWGHVEAPCVFAIPGGWRIFVCDYTTTKQINYSDSVDTWATWSARTQIGTPVLATHGTVIQYP
jgi:Glycosyl hydrolases family 43